MTTAAPSQRVSPSYGQSYRHHPYAHSGPSTSRPTAPTAPKWHAANSSAQIQSTEIPPSPPRSRRDNSETPSLGLSVAFGGARGGKWWDEELPPPPSSLSSILDSFKRSGEGDRELLLSILGAKKAEEERLTALIQTRLTILQARLSIHSAAAQLNAASPLTPAASDNGPINDKLVLPQDRTPSLSSSRGSLGSTSGPISPSYMPPPPAPAQLASEKAASDRSSYFHLPPPQSMLRRRSRSRSPPVPSHSDSRYPPVRIGDREILARQQHSSRGSSSPRSTGSDGRAPGLDMLLDAGMERERRDSGGRD